MLVVVAGLALAGCASIEPDVGSLPAGSELVATSGAAMRSVTSAHFTIDMTRPLPGVAIRHAEGDVDARGSARGSAEIAESGGLAEVNFILLKGGFYVQDQTGGYRKVAPAGSLFGLTSMLNPNHGMARVVTSVDGATTRATETVNGVNCYRITGTVAQQQIAALLPGIRSDVGATVWLAVDDAHLPVRAEFAVPGAHGSRPAKVDVSISKVNVPVTVTVPNT
jgi:lipoprotein LprG